MKNLMMALLLTLAPVLAQAGFASPEAGPWICTGYGYKSNGRTTWHTVRGDLRNSEAAARASAQEACHHDQLNACRITCYDKSEQQ